MHMNYLLDLQNKWLWGAKVWFFLPYLSGERTPHPDPHARGAFVGLTLRHSKAHLTRAVLEGVSYGLKDSLSLMQELGIRPDKVILSWRWG